MHSWRSLEWSKIVNRTREAIPKVEVVSIDRIQNEFLWEKHVSSRNEWAVKDQREWKRRSCSMDHHLLLQKRFTNQRKGLIWDLAVKEWGTRVTESAQYSCSYACEDSVHSSLFCRYCSSYRRTKQMFLAKVLTGDSYYSSSDQSLNSHASIQVINILWEGLLWHSEWCDLWI